MSFSYKVRALICAILLGIITCFSPAVTIIAKAVPAAVDYILTTFETIQLLQDLGILNPSEYADVWDSWYQAIKYDTQRDNLVSQGYIDESTPKESSSGVLNPDYLDAYIDFDKCDVCANYLECADLVTRFLPNIFRRLVREIRLGEDTSGTERYIRRNTCGGAKNPTKKKRF